MGVKITLITTSLTLFTLTYFICTVNSQLTRSGHGEFCNDTIKCDKKSWLACKNSTCGCMFGEDMLFDSVQNKCLSKTGESCKLQVSGLEGAMDFKLFEQTGCVPNADCGVDGICNCNSNYYESLNGTCLLEKGYTQNCTSNIECSQRDFLSCINGTCDCNATQIFDQGSCYGRAGMGQHGKSCVNGSVLLNERCICTPTENLYSGQDGKCHKRKGHKESCLENVQCQSFLICLNGTCSCNPEESSFALVAGVISSPSTLPCSDYFIKVIQKGIPPTGCPEVGQLPCKDRNRCIPKTYLCDGGSPDCGDGQDENANMCAGCKGGVGDVPIFLERTTTTSQCVGLAGKKCNSDARCVVNSNCSNGLCTCNPGFSKTSEGTCGIGYGLACSNTQVCSDSFRCTSGACRCPSTKQQVFDRNLNQHKCLGLIRGPCLADGDCIQNSDCVTKENTKYKQCACKSGFVENSQGKCDLAEGSRCDHQITNIQCDRIADLECVNNVCGCADTLTHFDPLLRRCLGLEGTRCKIEENTYEQICVENAQCVTHYTKLEGTCTCNQGFSASSMRLCEAMDSFT